MISDLMARRLMKTQHARSGEAKVVKLRLDSIRLDAGTQTRAHIDESTVTEYAEAMVRGDRFPPVVVFQSDGGFIMADGFHRVKAARRAKPKHILAEVRQGGRLDALRFALAANHKHGLRRTNADKRRAVDIALTEFGNLSDHMVADMCGVSVPFVGNLRHQLLTVNSSPPRVGKDGKLRALPVRSSNGSRSQELRHDSGANEEAENPAFIEIAEALAGVEALVERLADDQPNQKAAMVAIIAKVRSDLLQLEKRFRSRCER